MNHHRYPRKETPIYTPTGKLFKVVVGELLIKDRITYLDRGFTVGKTATTYCMVKYTGNDRPVYR
jgi:hypothetical protein